MRTRLFNFPKGILLLLLLLLLGGILSQKRFLLPLLRHLPLSSLYLGPPKSALSAYLFAKQNPSQYQPIVASHHLYLPPFPILHSDIPKERGIKSNFQVNTSSRIDFSEAFVLTLDKGRVYGRNGDIITQNDQLLEEVSVAWISTIDQHPLFRRVKLYSASHTSEQVAVIACKSPNCYFHWMFDILPRFELLRRSQLPYDKICLNVLATPFQKETLAHFNISEDKIIWAKKRLHVEAEKLIVPSLPGGKSGLIPTWVCEFLRSQFLPSQGTPKVADQLVYISRRQAPWRKLVNEEELLEKLRALGFKEYLLEDLTVEAQACLFNSASCIIAPHGAGLTNLVFCQPKTQVIELFSPHYIHYCYWLLSHQCQLNHACLLGSQQGLSATQKQDHDFIIPVEKVLERLIQL